MKKYKLLTIILIGIIILSGCSKNKKAVSGDDFNKKASEQNVSLTDVSSYYGIADKAYQTVGNSDDYKVLFVEGSKQSDIINMFLDEGVNIYSKAGIKDQYDSVEPGELTTQTPRKYVVKGKNWQSLEVITDSRYYYLVYVDKTLLHVEGSIEYKDLLTKLKNSVNY